METHDNVLSNVLVLTDVQVVLVEKVCSIANQSLMQVFAFFFQEYALHFRKRSCSYSALRFHL